MNFTFSPTPPSQKALLRSPCQAVTMTTSENVILYDLRTHWNHRTKVPRGGGATNSFIRPYLELATDYEEDDHQTRIGRGKRSNRDSSDKTGRNVGEGEVGTCDDTRH